MQNSKRGKELKKFYPQTETTFVLPSVSILLLGVPRFEETSLWFSIKAESNSLSIVIDTAEFYLEPQSQSSFLLWPLQAFKRIVSQLISK